MTSLVQQIDVMSHLLQYIIAKQFMQTRIVNRQRLPNRPTRSVLIASVEQMHLEMLPVISPDKCAAAINWAARGMTQDAKICFHVAEKLEWILTNPITLVNECEDRCATPFANSDQLARAFLNTEPVVEQHHRAVRCDKNAI